MASGSWISRALWRERSTRGRILVVIAAAMLLVGVFGPGEDAADAGAPERPPPTAAPTTSPDPATSPPSSSPPSTSPSSSTPATTSPAAETVDVIDVIDGDTIEVSGGVRVRLIGIDTPERGQCGDSESTARLGRMVAGRAAVLVPGARDDRDRYGRVLRYVEVDGVDANLEMIRSGHAIARYDSRDGYGRHTREDDYVAADLASPVAGGCSRTPNGGASPSTTLAPAGTVPSGGGGGATDPRHPSCRAAIAAGLGPYVSGRDPEYDWYRDGDGDGIVCE